VSQNWRPGLAPLLAVVFEDLIYPLTPEGGPQALTLQSLESYDEEVPVIIPVNGLVVKKEFHLLLRFTRGMNSIILKDHKFVFLSKGKEYQYFCFL
jgi:hypothetical protein